MSDLKQALRDFVATSNSGKYADEATLLSKFPELKGYDVQALRDFVATSNSGKYATEDEIFSKFPEFGFSGQPELKKKGITELPSEDTSLVSSKPLPKFLREGQVAAETGFATPTGVTPLPETITNVIPEMAPPKKEKLLKNLGALEMPEEENVYLKNIGTRALSGLTSLEKMVASIPETVINIASIPQNALAWATGWDIAANADTFKKQFGISNPVLNKLNEEEKRLQEVTAKFNKERYESSGIVDNIQKGNYNDAFELLGSSIVESAPVSIAMMMGGATLAPAELAAISTAGFLEQNREQLGEENPDMPEIEKTVKALGMSAAETVFSAIGTGTIGQVYKDIVKKEGVEVGKNIFRDGLVQAYKGALKKYGAPIGLLGEGIEEAATQITQNVLSNKPTFEGVADAFVTGAGSGVVFTAPINAMKAKDKVTNLVETYKSKEEINAVLKDTDTKLDQVFNVSKDAPITAEQIQIANTNKSRDILSKNLAKKVKDGEISEDEAKQSLYVFDKVQQVSNAVKDLKVTNAEKAQIATLLRQRDQLKTDIQNKDDVLVAREKQEIADLNNQIQQIIMESKPQAEAVVIEAPEVTAKRTARIAELEALVAPGGELSITSPEWSKAVEELQTLKKQQDAIQKQTTDEGVLRTEQPEVGLQQVVEGDQGPQVVATGTQEVTPEIGTQEVVEPTEDIYFNKLSKSEKFNDNASVSTYLGNLDNSEGEKNIFYTLPNKGIISFKEVKSNTNRFSLTANAKNDTPSDIKNAFERIEKYLPPNHELVEDKSISVDGLRVWNNFIKNGKYIQTGETNEIEITPIDKGNLFKDLKYTTENKWSGAKFENKNKALARVKKYLKDNNLDFKVKLDGNVIKVEVPVLKYKLTQIKSNEQPTTTQTERNEQVQPQRTGDGRGRTESRKIAPLKGAPSVKGINGPDPQLVAVAEDYAAKNGINLKRQSEYVEVDEDRAKRIADAYEQMANDPQNPKVKEAYQELIKQTMAQYQALVDAGYQFWFMDLNIPSNVDYASSPYNALRDMRENKEMGVFPTTDGYGASGLTELDVENNPLLADTGIQWPVGGLDGPMKNVLANDLFRAVHDAFGHGLEGSGFRARGEENAWQAHVRLFTGPAIAALTSETRGQNSWLNYGPNGETNKTAKVEDTVFAEQKVGLMPEFTWTEGLAGDMEVDEKVEVVAEPVETEPTLVIEEEQFVPMQASEVKTDAFTKDNAIDYLEDEKETESGRTVTYISSLTVEARNADGDPIGTITKLTDEDKIFSFTAEDIDGNEIGFDGFETLGEAKQAVADSYNKIKKKEFTKEQKKKAKEKAKVEAKKAKAKAKAEPTVEEQVTGALDDLLALDPNDKTTLQKIQSGLDKVIKDIDKFEKENLGVNIALPVMKTILKAIKVLVDAGVVLQEAIKRVAKDNNVNSRDVIDGINAVSQIAPIQAQYDALMTKADELIARQKGRGIADDKIVSNLDTFIRNSEVYKNANDAQKKIMEREARTKMGAAPKRAVSIGRVLGALKDITNISREEKMLVIKQIRDLSRDAAKELAKDIREMASKGKITSIQAANIVSRFGKVNMLNEISVSNFVDYMAKVFANAEYADKIDVAKSKLKMAKKNIVTKIGIADGLVGDLNTLFSMNPTLIPNEYLGRYLELVDMFGARQAVLTLDEKSVVSKDVKAILNEIDNEQSKADELADRFNNSENKVYKDNELDYAASVKKMLDEKEIDEKEAETMRKYKEDIAPQVEETELTEEELAAERKELTDAVKKSTIDGSGLSTKYERDTVKELSRLVKTDAVDSLTNTELKNLLKVIDNINNNYLPHYGEIMLEKLDGLNTDKVLTKAVEQSKMYKFSQLYSKVKAEVAMQGRTGVLEMIRRNPLFYIDQLFGNFKTKDIFNSLFSESAKAVAVFKTQLNRVQNILENAEEKVAKSFKLDPNKTTMSKFKMMTYMIQLEYESNKGNKEVNPASDYLKATIKHIDAGKSRFGERDAEMLQEILNDYSDADGNVDNEKLYNSFNQAEKDAIKDIRGINESLRERAEFTAAIIRGDRIDPLNNYVHLNVLHEFQPSDLTSGSAFVTEYNNAMRPSTKAKSLIARTGKVSPLNFDVFASAQRGAKFVLMDFNLTKPIRTARKTINGTIANLESKGRIPKEQRQIINAINAAFEETVDNLLTNTFTQDSTLDIALDYINKQGYRAVLAGTGRFISELSSNIGFAVISDPKALASGVKYRGIIMSSDAPTIMENLKSKQTNRIFPTDTLSGRLVDTSILSQASGIRGAVSKNPVKNKIQQIWNRSGKKYVNAVELQADALISTPDKVIMRPMWFGSFANQFENITGKEVDFEKIAANDEAYMEANKEALDKATELADERSVMVGATDNPFMGILKGTVKPDQKLALRAFNNMNNFMTKFLIFEYVTARTAIMAAISNGSLTKQQGGAVLGAVATRMVLYGLIFQMLGTGLMGLFFDDEEPETEKSFMQKLGQAFASAFSSLLIGRDFGNAVKNVLNYGIEEANEKYLDFLREGDYDPYKDGIAYTLIPRDDSKQTDLGKLLMNMGGAYTPALNTAAFIVKKVTEKEKVKEDAIARREKELNVRIPLEVLGNLGLVPLYKDIRKAVMKDLYKDLEKADRTKGDKKKAEAEKLQGFQNQEDMKRYDYDLWYRTFGPDAPDYDAKQAEKLIKREKDSVERAMKDEMYDYTPKPKKGKGGLQKLY